MLQGRPITTLPTLPQPPVMSNRTAAHAKNVHGTDPQMLIEKIIRERIYDCIYWKEECFGLSDSTILEKAIKLQYVGGVYGGNQRPSQFICLVLKLLQIQPEKDVILELISNDEFKYFESKLQVDGAF
jgi:pre-mRNA-splicing factor 38A